MASAEARMLTRLLPISSAPRGEVHPMTLQVLRAQGYDTGALRSKSGEEFAGPDAPPFSAAMIAPRRRTPPVTSASGRFMRQPLTVSGAASW